MAGALQPLTLAGAAAPARGRWLRAIPVATLLLFLGPIAAGLIGTWLPAFGYLPALGGESPSLRPWAELAAYPGLASSLRLTLVSGLLASLAAFVLAVGFLATCYKTRVFYLLRRLLAPLLAMPHVALAIGLAFLIAPSGWLARLISPGLTGWERPPDLAIVQDPYGLALALGLTLKELPFLLLMMLGAIGQTRADQRLAVARTLGYGPVMAWIKTVLPAIYPQIRLPIYAVIAYSLSVVDMAMILAPATPPPLAVLVLRWFNDPDLSLRFLGAAGATLQLLLVAAAIGLWHLGERLAVRLGRRWLFAGARGHGGPWLPRGAAALVSGCFGLAIAGMLGLAVWSFARRWRYPEALPSEWSLDNWLRHSDGLVWASGTTLLVGLAAAVVALALVLGCLENEKRHGLHPTSRGLWLLYLPLLVPQVAFLFGAQVIAVRLGFDGGWVAVVWSHLLFVLPYVFLALAEPFRALDERYVRSALCLGAPPGRVFWAVKLPMLLRPLLFALAVGFAVSVAQYLPTLFAGAGRFVTLTTEAVSLSAGGDRRVIAVYAFLQALLPLVAFSLALLIPAWLFRHRRDMKVIE